RPLASADIAITTRVPISAATLAQCPRLRLIAVFAIGTDMVDLAACRERGVQVCNVPAASNEAVAEHAIALFFALRRNIVGAHNTLVNTEDWVKTGNLTPTFGGLPGTCREEVMGIIGAGELGNRVATIARALGMRVLLSARKNPTTTSTTTPPDRTPFTTLLSTSTIIILTCPLTPSTKNLISAPEFSLMLPSALLINVARGGIVDEEALVAALKEKKLKGAASDVFVEEPAGEGNSALLREMKRGDGELQGRVVVSPHVAWYARSSIEK
ncbi:Glycerate dehydrogenase, partial [Lachnellula willkommii]